jgi:ketosteroid isomerase-like protein
MKTRLLFIIAGSIIGLALPVAALEQGAVDPEVRQQIETAHMKFDEAYNRSDAAGCTADYTQDAIEVWSWETAGGAAISQQAIEIRAAVRLALNPAKRVRKLVQVYPIGDEICAISEFEHTSGKKGYCVAIYVRELDQWKIRIAYWK